MTLSAKQAQAMFGEHEKAFLQIIYEGIARDAPTTNRLTWFVELPHVAEVVEALRKDGYTVKELEKATDCVNRKGRRVAISW